MKHFTAEEDQVFFDLWGRKKLPQVLKAIEKASGNKRKYEQCLWHVKVLNKRLGRKEFVGYKNQKWRKPGALQYLEERYGVVSNETIAREMRAKFRIYTDSVGVRQAANRYHINKKDSGSITIKDVADSLGVTKACIAEQAWKKHRLPIKKIGSRYEVLFPDFWGYLKESHHDMSKYNGTLPDEPPWLNDRILADKARHERSKDQIEISILSRYLLLRDEGYSMSKAAAKMKIEYKELKRIVNKRVYYSKEGRKKVKLQARIAVTPKEVEEWQQMHKEGACYAEIARTYSRHAEIIRTKLKAIEEEQKRNEKIKK